MQNFEESTVLSSFYERLRISLFLFAGVVASGTVGYKLLGGDEYSLLDCFYMTIITISTVGYGEILDISSSTARFFTVFLIIIGMGVLLYLVSNVTAFIVEGEMLEIFWRRKMEKVIKKMSNHYIVCGIGRIGLNIVLELCHTRRKVVAVDLEEEKVEDLRRKYPEVPVVKGDAIDNDLLLDAGIERARGIMVATGHDKDNMVITMTARQMNPDIRIVTRCNEMKNHDKLRRAGADSVVSSGLIGGLRMASEMVRPAVVSFLDVMLRDREKNLRVEEATIPEGSKVCGRSVGEIDLRSASDALLLAVRKRDGHWVYNPKDDFVLNAGMELIIMGSPEDRKRVEDYLIS